MRSSPSGRQIPDEIIRYVFPLTAASAGKVVAPIPNTPAVFDPATFAATGVGLADTASAGLLFTPFTALPGRLDLSSVSIITSGGGTGGKVSLQWQETITLPPPSPVGAAVPDFADPTLAAGVHTRQLDFSDVIIPDTGAAIAPYLTVPGSFAPPGIFTVLLTVAVIWKQSAIRNPLGTP